MRQMTSLPGPTEQQHPWSCVFFREGSCQNRFALPSWKSSNKFGMSDGATAGCKHPRLQQGFWDQEGLHMETTHLRFTLLKMTDPDFSCALCYLPPIQRVRELEREEAGPEAGTACARWLHDEQPSSLPRRSQRSCRHRYRCHQKSPHSQLDAVCVNHVGLTKTAAFFFPSIFPLAFYHCLLLAKLRRSTKAGKITMALSPDLRSI